MNAFHEVRLMLLLLIMLPIAREDMKELFISDRYLIGGIWIRMLLLILELVIGKMTFSAVFLSTMESLILTGFIVGIGVMVCGEGFGSGDCKLLLVTAFYLNASQMIAILAVTVLLLLFWIFWSFCRKKYRREYPFGAVFFFSLCLNLMFMVL